MFIIIEVSNTISQRILAATAVAVVPNTMTLSTGAAGPMKVRTSSVLSFPPFLSLFSSIYFGIYTHKGYILPCFDYFCSLRFIFVINGSPVSNTCTITSVVQI